MVGVCISEKSRQQVAHRRPKFKREKPAHSQTELGSAAGESLQNAYCGDRNSAKGEYDSSPVVPEMVALGKQGNDGGCQQDEHSDRQDDVEIFFADHMFAFLLDLNLFDDV